MRGAVDLLRANGHTNMPALQIYITAASMKASPVSGGRKPALRVVSTPRAPLIRPSGTFSPHSGEKKCIVLLARRWGKQRRSPVLATGESRGGWLSDSAHRPAQAYPNLGDKRFQKRLSDACMPNMIFFGSFRSAANIRFTALHRRRMHERTFHHRRPGSPYHTDYAARGGWAQSRITRYERRWMTSRDRIQDVEQHS